MSKLLSFLGGGVIEKVGNVIDNLSTSDEERLAAKQAMEEVLMQAEAQAQEQVTRRWEADMKSDNWLSKNIRPLICIFLTAIFVVLSVFDGAYFAGRSIEKIKKN